MTAPCPILGFTITITLHTAEREKILASLVELLDRNDLTGAVRGNRVVDVVVRREGSQATDADRALVRTWATDWSTGAQIAIGDVVDLTSAG